jgi:predicted ribosome quality control (RQC) complex YloA/Tae2 family protein
MTAMDVRALVILLRSKIVGLRVANVYDVSGRLYLLKMSKGGCKETLLIESGIRIHTTEFIKNNKTLPSGFSMKLRKHLRTRKCTSIRQLGMDRVIDIQFGKDEFASHIIIELYAQGNIILTDDKYTILSLLRSYTLDGPPTQDENGEGPARCAVKEKYPFSAAANLTEDNIITDPESIKKIIDDQFKSKGKESEKSEAAPVDSKK